MNHLDDALENFCDQHWPCEFVKSGTNVRCVNVRSGHTSKGHQSADGKVFATGEYVSQFSFETFASRFRDRVYSCLVQLLLELANDCRHGEPEDRAAVKMHQKRIMHPFFRRNSAEGSKPHAALTSHTACFCCLFGQADHCLPCGHVLCTQCLRAYGEQHEAHAIRVFGCPMEHIKDQREHVHVIHLKPSSAGIRILTLDGYVRTLPLSSINH